MKVFGGDWIGDVRFTFRNLVAQPGFAAVAVAILALGIGVNATVFTVTNAVLFRGFPHVDPDNRLVYLNTTKNGSGAGVSYPDFQDWASQAKSFHGLGVVSSGGLRLVLNDESGVPETCDGTQLSANSFEVLGQKPILGRDFTASDEAPGAPPVAILNYGFWERRYAKDTSLVGRTVRLNGIPTTVIGVMAPGIFFPHHRVDLWVPLAPGVPMSPAPNLQRREARVLYFAFGRMAEGVTIKRARAEMDGIGRRLETAYPLTNKDVRPRVMTFGEFSFGLNAAAFYGVLWGAVGFVLLIACANLANLMLGRAIGRFREISVRMALGAGRWRIIRQLLIESLTLSSMGGLLGGVIASAGVRAYELVADPPGSYRHFDYALDSAVLFYLAAISIATGLLFGLAPAIRLSKLDVNSMLKDGARGATSGGSRKNLSWLLVAGEMALAIVLLSGAGLMIRSFLNIYSANLGFKAAEILTAEARLPVARYPDAQAQVGFFEVLTNRVKSIPGVESAALTNSLPGLYAPHLPFELEGAPPADEESRPTLSALVISPDYFRTLGATVLSGRDFNDFDRAAGMPAVIVNQRFASTFWPRGEPLGKRLRLFNGRTADAWRTVVGVASNIVQNDYTGQSFGPVVYIPFRQRPASAMTVVARTRVPPGGLVTALRREIQAIDPQIVIGSGYGSTGGPKPLTESLAFNYWTNGVNAGLFLIFAALALLLAAMGLYAVVAHSVSQRTQELGIRMAIGATARDILKLVLLQWMFPAGIGLAFGLAGSLAVTRVLKSELVEVSPADPFTLVVAAAVLVLSAALGCLIPARRATQVDPVVALRHE